MAGLTRKDLVRSLLKLGLTRRQAAQGVDSFFGAIAGSLREGRNVSIVGFGTWEWRDRKPRSARNPRTGKSLPLGKRRALVFRPGPKLKKKLNP